MKHLDHHDYMPDFVTPQAIDTSQRILGRYSLGGVYQWMEAHTETFETTEGQRFRALVDRGVDDSSVLATFSEVGTSFVPRFAVKSQITRALIDSSESTSLIAILNGEKGDEWLNYSRSERTMVARGNMTPLIGRVARIMETIGNPSEVTLAGTSQGAVGALAYGADRSTPPAAVAAIEPPTVVDRSLYHLARDFVGQHNDLAATVATNFSQTVVDSDLTRHLQEESHIGISDVGSVWRRMTLPDTVAAVRGMVYATAPREVESNLQKGGAVVHAWGTLDAVSPVTANQSIAQQWRDHPRYESYELPLSHAGLTDRYAVYAALAERAWLLHSGNSAA